MPGRRVAARCNPRRSAGDAGAERSCLQSVGDSVAMRDPHRLSDVQRHPGRPLLSTVAVVSLVVDLSGLLADGGRSVVVQWNCRRRPGIGLRQDGSFTVRGRVMSKPVCLVTGVGPERGTGAETARRFAAGGYRIAMLARYAANLAEFERGIPGTTAITCDVCDFEAHRVTIASVRDRLGDPVIVGHNALRSVQGSILELDPDDLEKNSGSTRRRCCISRAILCQTC